MVVAWGLNVGNTKLDIFVEAIDDNNMASSLVTGSLFINNQKPELTGKPPLMSPCVLNCCEITLRSILFYEPGI